MRSSHPVFIFLLAILLLAPLSVAAQEHGAAPATQGGDAHGQAADQHQPSAQDPHGAAAGEHGDEVDHHAEFKYSPSVQWIGDKLGVSTTTAYWISVLINFLAVAVLVWLALRAFLPGAFRDRTAAIQKGMEEARRSSEEAQARLADIESRLSRIDAEIAAMQASAQQEAAAEEQRLRAVTEEDLGKIVRSAEQEIAAAGNVARRDLKQFAANLAVELAEKRISVTEAADRALVQDFVATMGTADGQKGPR